MYFFQQIQPPAILGTACRNRHHFTSLNVQILCGGDYRIYDVRSEAPGSQNDSKIFQV